MRCGRERRRARVGRTERDEDAGRRSRARRGRPEERHEPLDDADDDGDAFADHLARAVVLGGLERRRRVRAVCGGERQAVDDAGEGEGVCRAGEGVARGVEREPEREGGREGAEEGRDRGRLRATEEGSGVGS